MGAVVGGITPPYEMMYDNQTMAEISGEVVSVDKINMMHQMHQGVHLTVKTDEDTVSVHLGPAWYLENQDVKFMPGDKVSIKRSRITFDEAPTLIASEVRKGNQILIFRDSYQDGQHVRKAPLVCSRRKNASKSSRS
ncbi:hypothetical protein [Photobacterium atrarenae]|uniref:Magnetosome protein MamS/MamX domain-containing protein n=1 Tax=Photobacterium atrarenae TaxID=865757 RepID=A0ABY5GKE3_9GAMM|nr:hypothetical protein [Photobacterium atrarenae]UTV29702.1 hypothetical protein NNL38_22085 [Photobacterium atrarenae]